MGPGVLIFTKHTVFDKSAGTKFSKTLVFPISLLFLCHCFLLVPLFAYRPQHCVP